jgi:serine protease Do
MFVRLSVGALLLVFAVFLGACVPVEKAPQTARPTSAVAVDYAPPTPAATLPAVSSSAVLTPAEIYAQVAPTIAYIENDYGTGSGFLVADGDERYVVTNMHVMWPQDRARVVFPDGAEFTDVPLVDWDLMLDLAVLGPIETDLDPTPLADGENLVIGSPIYLVGYPNESQHFPQPALVHGLISRLRQQPDSGLTYFQTDAPTMGGQSGGVLLSDRGEIIGVTGISFGDVFAFATSSADVASHIQDMIAGQDVDGLGLRMLPTRYRWRLPAVELQNLYDTRAYVVESPPDFLFEVIATSENDIGLYLTDVTGEFIAAADETITGTEVLSATASYGWPLFLTVEQYESAPAEVRLKANAKLAPFKDEDDNKIVAVGSTVAGNLDYPGDVDVFQIDLEAGRPVTVTVRSELVDAEMIISALDGDNNDYGYDDDSGGGPFGVDARLVFTPSNDGIYLIMVDDADASRNGGYVLRVEGGE